MQTLLKLGLSSEILEGIAVTAIYVTRVIFDTLLCFYQIEYVLIEITYVCNCILVVCLVVCLMMFSATFNNFSVISRRQCTLERLTDTIHAHEGRRQHLQLKNLILALFGLIFRHISYLILRINPVSQVNLRSSGTYILYGCNLLRRLYNILYFL